MNGFLSFLLAFLGAAMRLVAPMSAEDSMSPQAGLGRYTMTPTEGGFLRLDTLTGTVSFCTIKDGLSVCRAGTDEKAALEAEVSRLNQENAELKAKLSGAPTPESKRSSNLPSEEDFERTLSMTERFVRRIMKIFREEAPESKP
jgi:hypothetical protein